jgi:DNA-directed RNA polymerase specialized sigma24 family protein
MPDYRRELMTLLQLRDTAKAREKADHRLAKLVATTARVMRGFGDQAFPYHPRDVVHSTFERILRGKGKLFAQKETDISLDHYLHRCTKNMLKGLVRHERAQRRYPSGGHVPMDDPDALRVPQISDSIHGDSNNAYGFTPDQLVEREQSIQSAQEKLRKVTRPGSRQRRYADRLPQFAREGASAQEIANHVGGASASVTSLQARTRQALEIELPTKGKEHTRKPGAAT